MQIQNAVCVLQSLQYSAFYF